MKPFTSASAFCAAILGVAVGGCNLAQPPLPGATIFQQMDTNHDGRLSREEFNAGFADAMLTVYNLDKNGSLTPAQWNDVERAGARGTFKQLDTNHDGKLSRAELSSGAARDTAVGAIFNRIDKDHDGVISAGEGRPSGLDRTPQERAQGGGL